MVPEIDKIVKEHGHIHFLLVVDTDVDNFTAGAWMQDALVGVKHLSKWKKMAIVFLLPLFYVNLIIPDF